MWHDSVVSNHLCPSSSWCRGPFHSLFNTFISGRQGRDTRYFLGFFFLYFNRYHFQRRNFTIFHNQCLILVVDRDFSYFYGLFLTTLLLCLTCLWRVFPSPFWLLLAFLLIYSQGLLNHLRIVFDKEAILMALLALKWKLLVIKFLLVI